MSKRSQGMGHRVSTVMAVLALSVTLTGCGLMGAIFFSEVFGIPLLYIFLALVALLFVLFVADLVFSGRKGGGGE